MHMRKYTSLTLLLVLSVVAKDCDYEDYFAREDRYGEEKKKREQVILEKYRRILSNAPEVIRNLPDVLNTMNLNVRPPHNMLVLLGETGVGKTAMMYSILFTLEPEWSVEIIGIEELRLLESNRYTATAKFKEIMRWIESKNTKTIVVFDEMNRLLENYENPHYDTDGLSTLIWQTLDRCTWNPNIFFIATMSRMDRIPQQLQERLMDSAVEIKSLSSQNDADACLIGFIRDSGAHISDENLAYLLEKFGAMGMRKPRSIESLGGAICYRASCKNGQNTSLCITKECIDDAIDNHMRMIEVVKPGRKPEADDERRHKEHMKSSKEMHEESMRINKELHEDHAKRIKEIHAESMKQSREMHQEHIEFHKKKWAIQLQQKSCS